MYTHDYQTDGFHWLNADNAKQSVYTFYREDEKEIVVCVLNNLPIGYDNYDILVPIKGTYHEILNTESAAYDGCGMDNPEALVSKKNPDVNAVYKNILTIKLAPFAAVWLSVKKK
jgi:1,4-alpha-glucan branching enzyme